MQNNFEKQVQEKMDELRFVPTEPVWQNIEKQIRIKNDRRRLLFWLPFSILLLGGGLWWAAQDYSKNTTASRDADGTENTKQQQNHIPRSATQLKRSEQPEHPVTNNPLEPQKNAVAAQKTQPHNPQIKEEVLFSAVSSARPKKEKKAQDLRPASVAPLQRTRENSESTSKTKNEWTRSKIPANNHSDNETSLSTGASPIAVDSTLSKIDLAADSSANHKLAEAKTDTAHSEEILPKPKDKARKWQWGIMAHGGISGNAKNFGSFTEDKMLQDLYAAPPNNSVPVPARGSSPVTPNWAFSAGVLVKKELTRRLGFSTGLHYHYYSSHIAVGPKVSAIGSFSRADSSQFYLNSGTNFKDYRNQFHFLALPVSAEWQMFQNLPLHLRGGLSLQWLIGTNALLFDKASSIYYSNKRAFNKTQLFSDLGLSYQLFTKSKTALWAGPQLQYGITNFEKNTSGKHLFSLGVTARLLFQKN